VFGAREDLDEVRLGEVRAKHEQAREMELAGGESVEQCWEASDETSGGNAPESLVLRQAQFVDTVGVEARAGPRAVNAARFDLAEVDEELGKQLVRTTHEAARPFEELGIGELRERRWAWNAGCINVCVRLHARTVTPGFRCSLKARSRAIEHRNAVRIVRSSKSSAARLPRSACDTFRVPGTLATASVTNSVKANRRSK
jgi:hypothetical protein